MKRTLSIIVMLAAAACTGGRLSYYSGSNSVVHDETLFAYIQARPEYAKFAALVEETGTADYLTGTTLMTLFAPTDETFPAEADALSAEEKKQMVLNHIALTTLYGRNFARISSIHSLAGKNISVAVAGGATTLDGVVLTGMDQVCSNGVLHTPAGWLLPRKNLSEWLHSLGDAYSLVRDSIIRGDERTFDKAASPIKGVDEQGRVVYDSVWVVTNRFLGNVDIADEGIRQLLMIPSNDAIAQLFRERNEWLTAVGQPELCHEDSLTMVQWILGSALLRGTSFQGGSSVRSVTGNEIRTDYFHAQSILPLSNGVGVALDRCYVPKDLHYRRVSFNPYYIRLVVSKQSDKAAVVDGITYDTYYPSVNPTNIIAKADSQCANLQFNTNNPAGYYYKFMSMASSDSTATATLSPLVIMPGEYNLRMRFCSNDGNLTDSFDIYRLSSLAEDATEEFLATIDGITSGKFGEIADWDTDGLVKTRIRVTSSDEPIYLKVVIPKGGATGTARRMFVGNCTLVPQDNY